MALLRIVYVLTCDELTGSQKFHLNFEEEEVRKTTSRPTYRSLYSWRHGLTILELRSSPRLVRTALAWQ